MQEIAFYDFTVVQRYRDYINFSIRYTFKDYVCSSSGMGWMINHQIYYYLNLIVINDQYAKSTQLHLIGVADVGMRHVFEHAELDALTKRHINNFYKE